MFGFGRHHRKEEIIINNGNNTTIVQERRGLFGRREEIISTNNGMGRGNTTIIQQRRGLFGPREEVIVNNRGMGRGGTTIIEERGGFFGPREEIIVNNGGFGMGGMGGTTIIEEGGLFGREEIIVNNRGFGMGGTTVIEEGGFFGPRQQIIIDNGFGGTTIIEEGGMFGGQEIIINNNQGYGYGGNMNQQYRQNQYYGNQYTSPRNMNQYQNNQYQNYRQQPQNNYQQGYQNNQQNRNQQYPNNQSQQYQQQQQQQQKLKQQQQQKERQEKQRQQKQRQQRERKQKERQERQRQQKERRQKQRQEERERYERQRREKERRQRQQKQRQEKQRQQRQRHQRQRQQRQRQQRQRQQRQRQQRERQQRQRQQRQRQQRERKQRERQQRQLAVKTQKVVVLASEPTIEKKKQINIINQTLVSQPKLPQNEKPVSSLPTYPEICAFAYHFNRTLKGDPQLKLHVPMNPNNFFNRLQDGVVYCKFINYATKGNNSVPTISPMAINLKPQVEREAIENLNIAIDSAKSLGCYMTGINSQLLFKKSHDAVLAFVWQLILLIQIHISNTICFRKFPQICLLRREDEDHDDFKKLTYKQILIRWLNYQIQLKGNIQTNITNLGKDLMDCSAYGAYLANNYSLESSFWEKNNTDRAKIVINECVKNKIDTPIHHTDILAAKPHLGTILCFDMFTANNGLSVQITETVKPEPNTLINRQIQMFGNWINSLGLKGVTVTNLISDLKTGQVLLAFIDKISPKTVDWNKFSNKFGSRVHIIQNCNYVVDLCRDKLGLQLVNISGMDIVDGKVNLILSIVWQLCNIYWQKKVGKIVKSQLVQWANSKVSQQYQVSSLEQRSLSSGVYILQVVESLKPKTVDFSLLKPANTQENIIININYCLSCVRKLGAEVITLWQHIYEVDSKFIALILAELRRIQKTAQQK